MERTIRNTPAPLIEKEGTRLSLQEFEKLTGAKWAPRLEFAPDARPKLETLIAKLQKKGQITTEQKWLGAYFRLDILSTVLPDVAIRWISPTMGWGVFALKNLPRSHYIGEYEGLVRKWTRADDKNSYCYAYNLAPETGSPYVIDARDQGGISRYINHSNTPNLEPTLATYDGLNHFVLYTKRPIAKDEQLCYDYGPSYWAKRNKPLPL